jgi:integrase
MRRRKTSTGEIRYDVRYRVGSRFVSETFKRHKDAEALLCQVEVDERRGAVLDPSRARERFSDYAAHWLTHRTVKGRPLSPSTRRGYEGLLRRNLLPAFAGTAIGDITPEWVRDWFGELGNTAGPDQAAKSYRLLRAILNTAVEDERIARNPCRIRGAGIEKAPERPLVDTDLVLDLASAIEPQLCALVLLAGFVGLRTGELLGLRRGDVDVAQRWIHVRRQAQEVAGFGRVEGAPKSEAGRRTVAVPQFVIAALEEHLARYVRRGPDSVLFVGLRSRRPVTRSRVSASWRAACAEVGAPPGLRIHDLRHHAATLTARMPGITTKELMTRIGHSSPRAALIYQHAAEERDRAIADYLDDTVRGVRHADRAILAPSDQPER